MYRIQANQLPIGKGTLSIGALRQPVLETYNGKYTSSLSSCVTNVTGLESGCYIIVISTFEPQKIGKYDLAINSNYQVEYQ